MLGKIVSPRLERLEREFLESGGSWEKVKVGDLFDIHPTKNYGITNNKLFETKGEIPVVVNSSTNNGVGGYVDLEPLEKGGIITFSDTTTADSIFYQPRDFIGYSHVQGMYPYDKNSWSEKSLKYLCSVFRGHTKGLFDYGNKFNRNKAKEILINLPFLNSKINFSYMEKFIEELEAERIEELEVERIEELEAYLVATGLKDYHLTKYDEKILDKFDKLAETSLDRQTDRIRLEDILDWQTSIKELNPLHLGKLSCNGDKYPFYGQAIENNGIISYISLVDSVLNNKNAMPTILIHSNNQNIVYLETPFYLKDGHGATSVLQNKKMSKHSALYLMGAIQKVIKERFNYNAKATKIGLKNTFIEVPITDSECDFQFMEDFIKVIEKIVIKDVVLWADKKIEATKLVISKI